jgi:hypothetical protein
MTCAHDGYDTWCAITKSVHGLPVKVPHRLWRECAQCGAKLNDISLGPSNDNGVPWNERHLAAQLRDIHLLWQPGRARDKMIAIAVDEWTTRWPKAQERGGFEEPRG